MMHTVRYTELVSDRFKGFWSDQDMRGTIAAAPAT